MPAHKPAAERAFIALFFHPDSPRHVPGITVGSGIPPDQPLREF
jgi:hypothetical protein